MVKFIIFFIAVFFAGTQTVYAALNPLDVPNNNFGIGILSPEAELSDAAQMVNSGGDWGYVTLVIKKSEMDTQRWQGIFNQLNDLHLIPIVRIATDFDSQGQWDKPDMEDSKLWADFLSSLYWPTKNRYVQIYNEVNRAGEWGGVVDPQDYASILDETISELREKSDDFFVLAAPMDLSAPSSGESLDAAHFYSRMESSRPGIFNRLDGWASHSYPNPGFVASPNKEGRTGITGYKWELLEIAKYRDTENLPVFITETGWVRKTDDLIGLDEYKISQNYVEAFEKVWTDKRIVAVSPFILSFEDGTFEQFSFKRLNNSAEPKYFSYYYILKDFPKTRGEPVRENGAVFENTVVRGVILQNLTKDVSFVFKNTGNKVWHTASDLGLTLQSEDIELEDISWSLEKVYPGQSVSAIARVKIPKEGDFKASIEFTGEGENLISSEIVLSSQSYLSFIFSGIRNII